MANSHFKFPFSCSISARMAAELDCLVGRRCRKLRWKDEGSEVRWPLESWRGGRELDEVIVVVDWFDGGGGSIGGGGRCGMVMGGLGEVEHCPSRAIPQQFGEGPLATARRSTHTGSEGNRSHPSLCNTPTVWGRPSSRC